jgi:membrane protease YdiL (CAAX protease family)
VEILRIVPETPELPRLPTGWRSWFVGPLRLRTPWRLALFVVVMAVLATAVRGLAALLHLRLEGAGTAGWDAASFAFDEGLGTVVVLLATVLVAKFEHLTPARYGLPWKGAFGARFWEGSLWGFAAVSALVGMIALLGGYHASGFAFAGWDLARRAALWLVAMLFVGMYEEAMFRAFPLAALTDGLGFWPAALLLSGAFCAVHYFLKPMENAADALSVGLIGLFLCFSLRRTGSLWFAIGFHFAFDFAALPFYGAPNTGNGGLPIAGHLVAGAFGGPEWLSGGPRGAEASLLVFPVIVALFALLHLRFRHNRFPTAPRGS